MILKAIIFSSTFKYQDAYNFCPDITRFRRPSARTCYWQVASALCAFSGTVKRVPCTDSSTSTHTSWSVQNMGVDLQSACFSVCVVLGWVAVSRRAYRLTRRLPSPSEDEVWWSHVWKEFACWWTQELTLENDIEINLQLLGKIISFCLYLYSNIMIIWWK